MVAPSCLTQQDGISVLPQELLRCIAERLPWGLDVANFRLTGRLWRNTVPLVNFAPLLMLLFDAESADGAVIFYRPTDGETIKMNLPELHGKVVCGSSHGWLSLVDVSATVTLLNPFTGATVDLPPAHKYIHEASRYNPLPRVRRNVRLDKVRDEFFRQIVLSSPPASGDCVAMASLPCSEVVAFCRVGVDRGWRTLRVDESRTGFFVPVCSIVHCRGSTFLVYVQSREAPSATSPSLHLPHPLYPRGHINVDGELHVVGSLIRPPKAPRFTIPISYSTQVYKCDVFVAEPTWSRVTDVGHMTLFVSNNFMTGFGGATLLGLTKNSIYFSAPVDGPRDEEDPDHELEISDISNGTSEWLCCHNKTGTSSAALCWIQPKPTPWTQGGGEKNIRFQIWRIHGHKEEEKLVLEMLKDHKRSLQSLI